MEKIAGIRKSNLSSPKVVLLQKDVEEKDTIFELKQKYKDAVLFELYESEKMLHSTLANRLPVSPSGLNAVVKKLNEADPPPIYVDKQGKFTFYSLAEAGTAYVREELLPEMCSDVEDEERVHDIFRLLSIFKDRNTKKWTEVLNSIVNEEADFEEQEEGYGFVRELQAYRLRSSRGAEAFLGLAVAEKELQKKILDYLEKNKSKNFESAWDVLNYWEQVDCIEVYGLIDALFLALPGKEAMPESSGFALPDIRKYMELVLDKLQVSLLQAILQGLSKKEAMKRWIDCGLEKHLALYLAEKYESCYLQEEKRKERRVSCI